MAFVRFKYVNSVRRGRRGPQGAGEGTAPGSRSRGGHRCRAGWRPGGSGVRGCAPSWVTGPSPRRTSRGGEAAGREDGAGPQSPQSPRPRRPASSPPDCVPPFLRPRRRPSPGGRSALHPQTNLQFTHMRGRENQASRLRHLLQSPGPWHGHTWPSLHLLPPHSWRSAPPPPRSLLGSACREAGLSVHGDWASCVAWSRASPCLRFRPPPPCTAARPRPPCSGPQAQGL